MKTFLKWSTVSVAAAAALIVTMQWVSRLSRSTQQGLAHAERITADARQAMEKTADALAHTEDALQAAQRTLP